MSLNWQWSDKIGEMTVVSHFPHEDQDNEVVVSIYAGNALAIFVYEYEDDTYQVQSFWSDKEHAKRMLGLDKKDKDSYGQNEYDKSYWWVKEIRFDKNRKEWKKLIPLLSEAKWKNDMTIKFVTV